MDAQKATVLYQFAALKGLNTQAALPDAPVVLHNAHLTRSGGYAPQRAGRTLKTGVTAALRTGVGNDLWALHGGAVRALTLTGDEADTTAPPAASLHDLPVNPDGTPLGTLPRSLDGAALLMPGLALLPNGEYLTRQGTVRSAAPALEGVTVDYPLVSDPSDEVTGTQWQRGKTYVLYAQRVRDGAVQVIPIADPGHEYRVGVYFLQHDRKEGDQIMLFVQTVNGGPAEYDPVAFLGTYTAGAITLTGPTSWKSVEDVAGPQVQMDTLVFTSPLAAEYHQGRIWLVPGGVTNKGGFGVGQKPALNETLPADGLTLYYSEVTAPTGRPRWRADNTLTLPARCSRRIVALASVGRTLYVLCDREVFAVQGNSDRDLLVENLGDSIGCVAAGSVQTLGGAVLYVSDSGVLMLRGGQVQEVGADVRDAVVALGRALSSTTSHRTETYLLRGREGVVYLYHLREQAWVTRDDPGGPLVRAGGLPLALAPGGLVTLDDPAGAPLDMRVVWPHVPAGGWALRKQFRAVALGVTGAGVVHASASVLDGNAAALRFEGTPAPVTAQRSLVFGLKNASGEACAVTLEVTGDVTLLPPVQVTGSAKGEVGAL